MTTYVTSKKRCSRHFIVSFFSCGMCEIEVFSEEAGKQPQLILRIYMKEDPVNQLTFGVRQSRTIEYKDTHSSRTDEWLFYKNSVPAEYLPTGVTAKDRRIELALPRKSTE